MKLVYKFNHYKHLNELDVVCYISNDLYNQANYIIKHELDTNHKWIRYNDLDKIMKVTPNLQNKINYKKLKAQASQQILRLLDKNWISYFRSLKEFKKNPKKFKGLPKQPSFKKSGDKHLLIYTNQACQIKDNQLILAKNISINIPKCDIDFSKFQQIRVLPKNNYYEINIVYIKEEINFNLNPNNYLSIDLGINNLATCISKDKSFIFSGETIKSVNQYFNKMRARYTSFRSKKGNKENSKKLRELSFYRNNFIKDQFHKMSRLIVNYCIVKDIGTVVAGYNNDWKDSIQTGKVNNQKFTAIAHKQFLDFLKYKLTLVGIKFINNEESYTSKCDGLALESIKKHETYLGKRKFRGLFQSSVNKLINADVNGALNILRKVIGDSHEFIQGIINSVVLFNPVKIRFTDISRQTLLNSLVC